METLYTSNGLRKNIEFNKRNRLFLETPKLEYELFALPAFQATTTTLFIGKLFNIIM